MSAEPVSAGQIKRLREYLNMPMMEVKTLLYHRAEHGHCFKCGEPVAGVVCTCRSCGALNLLADGNGTDNESWGST